MFGAFKKAFGAGARAGANELKAQYGESKDFLEAVAAAAALVAFADGECSDAERAKVTKLLVNHPTLGKVYDRGVIEKTVEDMMRRAVDGSGRHGLGRELMDIKGRPDAQKMAEDIYLMAVDVASADGSIGEQEAAVLAKIAKILDVDPSRFEF